MRGKCENLVLVIQCFRIFMMMVILKEPKKMKILLMVRIERERGGGQKRLAQS